MNLSNSGNWGPAVLIVVGYVLSFYFQNKRLDDFKEALYKYIDVKFETVDVKLKAIDDRLKAIEDRLNRIENKKLVG